MDLKIRGELRTDSHIFVRHECEVNLLVNRTGCERPFIRVGGSSIEACKYRASCGISPFALGVDLFVDNSFTGTIPGHELNVKYEDQN